MKEFWILAKEVLQRRSDYTGKIIVSLRGLHAIDGVRAVSWLYNIETTGQWLLDAEECKAACQADLRSIEVRDGQVSINGIALKTLPLWKPFRVLEKNELLGMATIPRYAIRAVLKPMASNMRDITITPSAFIVTDRDGDTGMAEFEGFASFKETTVLNINAMIPALICRLKGKELTMATFLLPNGKVGLSLFSAGASNLAVTAVGTLLFHGATLPQRRQEARAKMRPIRQAFRRLANQTIRARRFEVSPLMPVFSWVSKTWRYMDYSDELFGKVTTATSYELHCDFSFQTPPEDCPIYFAARQGDKKWQKRFAAIDYTINKKDAAFVSPQMGAQKKLADAKALAEADVRQRLAAVFLCQQIYT